ncbi:MAG: AAA family ATPase, partial [Desulfobacterales bacterium]|nr:AAA family ATPase [Desulfobacterales bacterium]
MKKLMPIGVSDFKELIEDGYYYVDKTLFIREIMHTASKVTLLPRPRRFGKTLNLSMLRYFFEKNDEDFAVDPGGDSAGLFNGTAIRDDKLFHLYQGNYPVIYMTFKGLKERSWEWFLPRAMNMIRDEFRRHEKILDSKALSEMEKKHYRTFLENEAAPPDYADALRYLSMWLHKFYEKRVVILIDEYDAPLHAGYTKKYYEDVVDFMRNLLTGGLKDNVHLFKGVLTGILRVAKESIFSDLNNPGVYTLLSPRFSRHFGFTEQEVQSMLESFDMGDLHGKASRWYNGYLFGRTVIYNPWSVINFIDNQGEAETYWVNTGSTEIIDKLVTRKGAALREEFGQLLEGKSIEEPVDDAIVMNNLDYDDDLLWSFLLFSGYLKPVEKVDDETYKLKIPNREVKRIYRGLIKSWFSKKAVSNSLKEMLTALERGDVEGFERYLRTMVKQVMSYHDFSGEPEKVYHALVLGMLVWLSGKYEIRSNRESGYGRYDLALTPKDPGKQGIIM